MTEQSEQTGDQSEQTPAVVGGAVGEVITAAPSLPEDAAVPQVRVERSQRAPFKPERLTGLIESPRVLDVRPARVDVEALEAAAVWEDEGGKGGVDSPAVVEVPAVQDVQRVLSLMGVKAPTGAVLVRDSSGAVRIKRGVAGQGSVASG